MNIEKIKQVLEQKVNEPETIMFNGFLHNLDDLRTILAQHEEIERLREMIHMMTLEVEENELEQIGRYEREKEQSK